MKAIFLIDDDKVTNFIHERLIRNTDSNFKIFVFTDVQDALNHINNEFTNTECKLAIFLDINIPVMDGFNFLDEFLKFPASITQNTKIAMLTTFFDEDEMKRSKTYKNVIEVMHKPLNETNIKKLISFLYK